MASSKLKYTLALLAQAGRTVVTAANSNQQVNARLPADYVDTTDSQIELLEQQLGLRGQAVVRLSDMTKEQNAALKVAKKLTSAAQDTAMMAFPGDKTKWRELFGLGDGKGKSLPIVVERALLSAQSLGVPAVANAMAAKGWIAADTTKLAVAADVLRTVDVTQEGQKGIKKMNSDELELLGLDVDDRVKTIQNAARLQWDDSTPANRAILVAFQIGIFPPKVNRDVPTIPRKFTVKPGAAGSKQLKIDYNISKLASDYVGKILDKATGAELMTFTTTDNKTTVTVDNATSGTAVQVILVARNDAGESKPTRPVTAKIP